MDLGRRLILARVGHRVETMIVDYWVVKNPDLMQRLLCQVWSMWRNGVRLHETEHIVKSQNAMSA